jgi:hypothetical protein
MRSFRLPALPILSLASDADIPPAFLSDVAGSALAGDDGGDGALGFHDTPPGFGRGAGAGPGGGFPATGFSNAAILSRNEPTLGFVDEGEISDIKWRYRSGGWRQSSASSAFWGGLCKDYVRGRGAIYILTLRHCNDKFLKIFLSWHG